MKRPTLDPKNKRFNWLTALEWLVENPKVTTDEFNRLRDAASQWPTCACGELCKKVPKKDRFGDPVDDILFAHGNNFFYAVSNGNWSSALSIFRLIEARTAELLRKKK